MAARGLHLNTSVNFSNISDPRAIDAKEKLLTLIQGKKEISVAAIYNAMAPELCANPTTKTLLMQLYYENNLRIESVAKNGAETNFVLIFESRRRAEPKVTQVASKAIVKNQSNIEDLIDDN
jgi:lipopolysaccharide export LptBFGC system permease protein LptF